MNIKKQLGLAVIIVWGMFMPALGHAQQDVPDINAKSYIFYLSYDNGQIVADPDYETAYDYAIDPFEAQDKTDDSYRGEIIGFDNSNLASFYFDPQNGDTSFMKGKIIIFGPYFDSANLVNFYNSTDVKILTLDLTVHPYCNHNAVCDKLGGEDAYSCSTDCGVPTPTMSEGTPFASLKPPQASVTPSSGGSGSMGAIVLIGTVIVLFGVGGWFGWRWWQRRKTAQTSPLIVPPVEASVTPPVPPPVEPIQTPPATPPSDGNIK